MRSTIRPCPFCACPHCEVVEGDGQPGDAFVVACIECGGAGPMAIDAESAIDLWNDRKCIQ
ncbi:MAG TPA: Lar family restriction alleviation protein [Acidobacteriaceae bacterium]|nr:Lar family restriction alleviation protein [Acidobacteriaceae bacterium]